MMRRCVIESRLNVCYCTWSRLAIARYEEDVKIRVRKLGLYFLSPFSNFMLQKPRKHSSFRHSFPQALQSFSSLHNFSKTFRGWIVDSFGHPLSFQKCFRDPPSFLFVKFFQYSQESLHRFYFFFPNDLGINLFFIVERLVIIIKKKVFSFSKNPCFVPPQHVNIFFSNYYVVKIRFFLFFLYLRRMLTFFVKIVKCNYSLLFKACVGCDQDLFSFFEL
jgi:hypothetical protein